MEYFKIMWAVGEGSTFYPTGVEAEVKKVLVDRLEDLLFMRMSHSSTEPVVDCTCLTVGGPGVRPWSYARDFKSLERQYRLPLKFAEIAAHVVADPHAGHIVQVAKHLFLKLNSDDI